MTGHYSDADYAAEAARVRTGICPVDAEWDAARADHEAAVSALEATPLVAVPQPVREAVDALGNLLAIWDGYGENG